MDVPPAPSAVDNFVSLWPAVSAAVAGGAAWVTANWRARREFDRETLKVVDDLRERAHKTEMELGQIRAVLSAATGLRFDQITLAMVKDMVSRNAITVQEVETFILTMPRLAWIKKREGPGIFRMMQVSQVYADKYLGGNASYYADKLDSDVWPEGIAALFIANDEAAYISGAVTEVTEPIHSQMTGVTGHFHGVKWSFRLGQDTYICGLGVHRSND